MKQMLWVVFIVCALFPHISDGQEIKEGKINVGKAEMFGFILNSQYKNSLVTAVIEQKLSAAGIDKGKKRSKFYTCKGVTLPQVSPNKVDVYYRVQKKKRKSIVYFVVSKGYDNYVTTNSDVTISKNIYNFLSQIDEIVTNNIEIARKQEDVDKMNEKLEKEKSDVQKAQDKKDKEAKELEALKLKTQ